MPISRVLVVDDEEAIRNAIRRALTPIHEVCTAASGEEALEVLGTQPIDLVITDIQMPGLDGIELVRQVGEQWTGLPAIVLTGYGNAARSVEALRAGAFWFIEKPITSGFVEVIQTLARHALEQGQLRDENRVLRRERQGRAAFEGVIGTSPRFREVLEIAERVAASDSTVLITGESGTGKEVIARAIHHAGRRSRRLMVTVNCGAIPEQLLESELFGHVKGAFTNAFANRQGRFALADGGTIFLDEIGDMSPSLQVKLLRVLQERSFEPVDSSRPVHVDVRVIAATHQDLERAVAQGRFRSDLFYRLNVIPLHLPPLRERLEDIALLLDHFLGRFAEKTGRRVLGVSPEALRRLCDHDWPGNVRELENLAERLVLFCEGRNVGVEDLPPALHRAAAAPPLSAPRLPEEGLRLQEAVARFEADLILQALERTRWNKQRAADLLGLNRPTLFAKMQRAHLERPDEPPRRHESDRSV